MILLKSWRKVLFLAETLLIIGCKNCPPIPPAAPPQVITVSEPCMDPFSKIDPPIWPDKIDGVYIINESIATQLGIYIGHLITYIEEQQAKCLKHTTY